MALEKDVFFDNKANQGLALTFDDVRMATDLSTVPAAEINVETRFSRSVALKIPIVSAAMDTVTNAGIAIALAKLSGIGGIHGGYNVEEERNEVRRVKLHLNGRIDR